MRRVALERLRRRADFDRVFSGGRSVAAALVIVRFARRVPPVGTARVGIAVGKRIGSAVVRNRLRRRWREVVRLGPPIAVGWDVVVVVRAGCRSAGWDELRRAWVEALRRGGIGGAAGVSPHG